MSKKPAPLHPSITAERVIEAVESRFSEMENPGFCRACGADASDCEPDAQFYECESCHAEQVFGAEEILLEIA